MKWICCLNTINVETTKTEQLSSDKNSDTPLTDKEKIGLKNSEIKDLTIVQLEYLMSTIDAQEQQWSPTYRNYRAAHAALKVLQGTPPVVV
jgi:hypothetical protein